MENNIKKLQFQNEKSPSIAQKISIITWYIVCVIVAVYFTFFKGNEAEQFVNTERQVALFACAVIYVVRAAITLFVFVKRKIPWWEAAWGGSILGIVLFFFLYYGLLETKPLGIADLVGILLYLTGSYIGTASEYSRHIWKARSENQGHLYVEGLFKYARHINYFGDLLLFLGFAILTNQLWTVFVPLGMGLNFVLMIIPAHDAYLASRYGGEYTKFAQRTRKLIPFLY